MAEPPVQLNYENAKDINNYQENDDTTRAALQELLQTASKLRKAVELRHETKRQWRQRDAALELSNWKIEREIQKLRKITQQLDRRISGKAEENRKSHRDLQYYKSRNKQEAADFWANFQEKIQKYTDLFTNAHIEYSSDCLKQDIEGYRRSCQNLRDKITRVKQDMEDAKSHYGLVEIGTNEEAKLLKDLDAVKKTLSDKTQILGAKETAEELMNVLKLKIKQKEHDIAYLKKSHDK